MGNDIQRMATDHARDRRRAPGGMCGLFLLGMISRRARSPAAVTGVITGVLVILWMSFPKLVDYLLSQPAGSQADNWRAA